MPYRRDFPATTRIEAFEAEKGMILPANLLLAWIPDREQDPGIVEKYTGKLVLAHAFLHACNTLSMF